MFRYLFVGVMLSWVSSAIAHHSAVAYDLQASASVQGNVVELLWRNPHVQLHLDVEGDDGQTERWVLETAATNNLVANGWRRELLEAGTPISVEYRPMRSGQPGGVIRWVSLSSGAILAVDRDSPESAVALDIDVDGARDGLEPIRAAAISQKESFESRMEQWLERERSTRPEQLPIVTPAGAVGALDPDNLSNPAQVAAFDMTGVWQFRREASHSERHNGADWYFMPMPELTAEAQATYDEIWERRRSGEIYADPTAYCYPPGMPRIMTRVGNLMILQQDTAIYMIHRMNNDFRTIFVDGRGHIDPEIRIDSYNGDSVGYWDDDSLYVETVGFGMDNQFVQAGVPMGEAAKVQERYRLLNDGNTIAVEFVLTDPDNWVGEWIDVKFYDRVLKTDIEEASCILEDATIPGLGQ